MTIQARKAEELIKQMDFSGLRKSIEDAYSPPSEMIAEDEGVYLHQFVFHVEDNFFEDVRGVVGFQYNLTEKNKQAIAMDCKFVVNGIYTEMNDIYFYVKNKNKLKGIFVQVERINRKLAEEKMEMNFYTVNYIPQKNLGSLFQYTAPQAYMALEDEFLALMHDPQLKEAKEQVKKINLGIEQETNDLMKQIEKESWQKAVDKALEEKDFEALKSLSSVN